MSDSEEDAGGFGSEEEEDAGGFGDASEESESEGEGHGGFGDASDDESEDGGSVTVPEWVPFARPTRRGGSRACGASRTRGPGPLGDWGD